MAARQEKRDLRNSQARGDNKFNGEAPEFKRGLSQDEATSPSKRPHISPPRTNDKKKVSPLEYWTNELRWPKEYFEPELRGSAATTSTTPKEAKSAPCQSPQYKVLLETKGSFMRKSELGITNTSKTICRTLLEAEQVFPRDSLFHDDRFDETCEMVRDRNEAKVVQDIT
ncbi:reverse transcriptase protein [Rutstroemia sp. NJR-2017a WRK4]|nr:reverse transcriptase protein [Rutstroemia sp. NJR-2017a WRK4]